jgi:hypothetical protein
MNPYIQEPPSQKPPDVNVVVVTGDKNELNGMPVKTAENGLVNGGGSKNDTVGISHENTNKDIKKEEKNEGTIATNKPETSSFFDFTNFLIKKV